MNFIDKTWKILIYAYRPLVGVGTGFWGHDRENTWGEGR